MAVSVIPQNVKYVNIFFLFFDKIMQNGGVDDGLHTERHTAACGARGPGVWPPGGVYLFGSYARGEATESSDIDLLIDTTGTSIKSLVKLGEVYCALETALKKPVDVLTVSALDQRPCVPSEEHFRERVRKERVEVYGS